MEPGNRALTGIQNNIGPAGMDASSLGGTNLPYTFLDATRVGRNSETLNSQRYNPQELIANFNATFGNRVGLGQNIFSSQQGQNLHVIS